ncbi:hypothetical protein [Methylobacterium sp. NFXW15]|uniref:hypothetical protein n=1 Tax=Methylobacterium sp. NFXW15 TaxID=2819512 RepID=UPI003CF6F142
MARHEYRVQVEERRFYEEDRKGNDVLCKNNRVFFHIDNPIQQDHKARIQLRSEGARWMGVDVTRPKNMDGAKYTLLLATLAAEIQEWLTLTNAHQDIQVMLNYSVCGGTLLDVVFAHTSEYDRGEFSFFWHDRVIEYNGRSSIRYAKPEKAEQQEAA